MESDFSCEDTTQIPRDSPLGLILKNWQRLTGKNSLLSRPELISLSELMWPTCKLDNNNAWLELGGLNEELISNLMSHIHQDWFCGKLEHARLFMLLSHKERLLGPTKEHNVMLLRKGKRHEKKEPALSPPCVRGREEVEMDSVPFLPESLPVKLAIGKCRTQTPEGRSGTRKLCSQCSSTRLGSN